MRIRDAHAENKLLKEQILELQQQIESLKNEVDSLKKQHLKKGSSSTIKLENTDPSSEIVRDPNKVSVIMTNYNCQDFLERAIKSVLNQTHSNLELLIVDDASTDKSLKIINKFAKFDSRVRVFTNLEQRGTYWSKNSVIHKTTGSYITVIDSDDYDVPTKLERQLQEFKRLNVVCVTCLNDRKVSEFSNETERICFGYPSMMFKYDVFKVLGHYDTVKFGADSEFFDRVVLTYGKKRISHISEVLQISPRRSNGLTGLIPEGSDPRMNYVQSYRGWHANIKDDSEKYMPFPLKKRTFNVLQESIVPYSDLSNSIVVSSKSTPTLPVIMCVWKRDEGFLKTIEQLNSQTHKKFKLFIWNNNPEMSDVFLNHLKIAKFEYEFYTSPENVGGFGRFKYAQKIRRHKGLLDHCVFIDDDQTFGPELLETLLKEMKPNTISSQWGWQFKKLKYYGNDARLQRQAGESIHYAGTGGMIADMRVFDSEGLYECPTEYWFVEDLWLSYYANHILGYSLIKSAAVMKNGDDEHSLYKVVQDVKQPMLVDLVTNYGWNILSK